LVGVLVGVSVGVFVGVSVGVFVGVDVAVLKLRTTVSSDSVAAFVAETVTGTSDPTVAASTTIERQPLPAGTTIDDGTGSTPGRLLLSVTGTPAGPAASVRQTVIFPCPPPRITDCTWSARKTGARIATDRETRHPPDDAETTTAVSTGTGCVGAVKVSSVAPAGTVTVAGTLIAAFDEPIVTFAPPDGAGAERRTRKVTLWPPVLLPEPNRKLTHGTVPAAGPVTWASVLPRKPIAPATTVAADAKTPRRDRRDANKRVKLSKRAPSIR
jgi:hypothetical protein